MSLQGFQRVCFLNHSAYLKTKHLNGYSRCTYVCISCSQHKHVQRISLGCLCPGNFMFNFFNGAHSLNTQSSVYPVFLTAVAIFWKPKAIPLCFSIDLVLRFLLSWLLVLLPSTFVLDIIFSFSPLVSIP